MTREEFVDICRQGRMARLEFALHCYRGLPPFVVPGATQAAAWGQRAVLARLDEAGLKLHRYGRKALLPAIARDHLPVVKRLLRRGVPARFEADRPLRTAAAHGAISSVKELVEHWGANPRVRDYEPVRLAVARGHRDVALYLICRLRFAERAHLGDLVERAAALGDLDLLIALVQDAEINDQYTLAEAAQQAAGNGQMNCLVWLGGQVGADLCPEVFHQALVVAATMGQEQAVSWLVTHGGVDLGSRDYAAIRYAVRLGRSEVVKLLFTAGDHTPEGDALLKLAVEYRQREIAEHLAAVLNISASEMNRYWPGWVAQVEMREFEQGQLKKYMDEMGF